MELISYYILIPHHLESSMDHEHYFTLITQWFATRFFFFSSFSLFLPSLLDSPLSSQIGLLLHTDHRTWRNWMDITLKGSKTLLEMSFFLPHFSLLPFHSVLVYLVVSPLHPVSRRTISFSEEETRIEDFYWKKRQEEEEEIPFQPNPRNVLDPFPCRSSLPLMSLFFSNFVSLFFLYLSLFLLRQNFLHRNPVPKSKCSNDDDDEDPAAVTSDKFKRYKSTSRTEWMERKRHWNFSVTFLFLKRNQDSYKYTRVHVGRDQCEGGRERMRERDEGEGWV